MMSGSFLNPPLEGREAGILIICLFTACQIQNDFNKNLIKNKKSE